jgi:branched-chain amino acid transport system permease protein
MRILMLNLDRITGGASGLNLPTAVPSKGWFYLMALLFAGASFAAAAVVRASRFGLGLMALRLDLEAAEGLGVPTALFKNIAHALSAFIVGACGGLYATYLQFVHPDTVFGFTASISLVLIALIGGLGTLWGPVVGAVIFYAVQDYLQTTYPTFHLLAYGVLLILILLFEPRGLAGLAARLRRTLFPAAGPGAAEASAGRSR